MAPETINGIFAIAGALVGVIVTGLYAWVLQAKYRQRKELKVLLSRPKSLVDVHDTFKGKVSVTVAGEEVETVASIDYYVNEYQK